MNLKKRSFLKLLDFNQKEIYHLLNLAEELKRAKKEKREEQYLKGKNICLIFEKSSTRTKCAFEVAAADQGANTTYLSSSTSHMGSKESIKDTARVLGRMYDSIVYRGYEQSNVEVLRDYSNISVINGLTNEFHPTQALADLLTMQESIKNSSEKPLKEAKFAYVGDGRSNVSHSLMAAGCLMGMDVRLAAPKDLWPQDSLREISLEIAKKHGAKLTITDDVEEAVNGVHFIHTDVWLSMGEAEAKWEKRLKLLLPYQVNKSLLLATKNPGVKFMHCLPAFHNTETKIGKSIKEKFDITAMEVTEEVFESEAGLQFEQAENRLHTIKAILVGLLKE